jgi:hypothetical protein
MKEIENSKETHEVSVGNTDCNISAISGAQITIKGKWHPKFKRFGLGRIRRTHS